MSHSINKNLLQLYSCGLNWWDWSVTIQCNWCRNEQAALRRQLENCKNDNNYRNMSSYLLKGNFINMTGTREKQSHLFSCWFHESLLLTALTFSGAGCNSKSPFSILPYSLYLLLWLQLPACPPSLCPYISSSAYLFALSLPSLNAVIANQMEFVNIKRVWCLAPDQRSSHHRLCRPGSDRSCRIAADVFMGWESPHVLPAWAFQFNPPTSNSRSTFGFEMIHKYDKKLLYRKAGK